MRTFSWSAGFASLDFGKLEFNHIERPFGCGFITYIFQGLSFFRFKTHHFCDSHSGGNSSSRLKTEGFKAFFR
jgi:hypothetical protein